jgi:hypothetical protein
MRFRRFINENKSWQQSLDLYRQEMPKLQQMLAEAEADESIGPQEKDACAYHFRTEFLHQQDELLQLSRDLAEQQKRLTKDCANNAIYDIEAFCYQDIIRNRVKEVQKTFTELKCSFMSFLSTAL